MKKVFFSIIAFALTLSMVIGNTSSATTKMFRVWVNGKAVVDSKVIKSLLKATKDNLGKSIVIELRDEAAKGITSRNDENAVDVKNISITKLGSMFRVLVDGNVAVDSQNPEVILGTVQNVIKQQLGEKIEILPRDTVLSHDKNVIRNILALATQGKVIGSDNITVGSTREDVIQVFGNPVMESEGLLPGKREMMYPNATGLTGFTYSAEDYRISQVTSTVTDQFKQVFTNKDLVKVLGKPHKITKISNDTIERMMEKGWMPKKCKVLPVYTYKAGENYVHFVQLHMKIDKDHTLQMVFTSVDANCEAIEEMK